jgi:integrase
MSQSTPKRRSRKATGRPKKPYPDFPLTPHASGAWQKKIRGKIHYFGRWAKREGGKLVRVEGDGWKEALDEYKAVADDLHAGRTPRVQGDALTVADLCNRFLTAKLRQREAGEIGVRMFGDYKAATDRLVAAFGKTRLVDDLAADDFEALRDDLAKQYGPARLCCEIQRVRTLFRYAYESGLIDRPVRFGPQFKEPAASVLRRHRAANGEKMFEAAQLRTLLQAAPVTLKAMLLLAVNAGFGNHDCATLPRSALDLDAGWVNFPRPKTGIPRRCPLWPETMAALSEAIAARPEPTDPADAGLVFLTPRGVRWSVPTETTHSDNVGQHFLRLTKKTGIHQGGVGFYALRHTFRTIADGSRDQVAVDLMMGHTDPTMGARYRERVEDERLQAVAARVRAWLFGDGGRPDGTDGEREQAPAEAGEVREVEAGDQGGRPVLRLFAG